MVCIEPPLVHTFHPSELRVLYLFQKVILHRINLISHKLQVKPIYSVRLVLRHFALVRCVSVATYLCCLWEVIS